MKTGKIIITIIIIAILGFLGWKYLPQDKIDENSAEMLDQNTADDSTQNIDNNLNSIDVDLNVDGELQGVDNDIKTLE